LTFYFFRSEPDEISARKRRALECRNKALQEMSNRQNLFKSSHVEELGEIENQEMDVDIDQMVR